MHALADPVAVSYGVLAEAYDMLTAGYDYDRWLAEIERIALRHGLRGRTVLDVGCGTGKSFLPLLRAGYTTTGCDISPQMLDRAATKAPAAALHVADMRALPVFGEFDLVTCLDDALNHLLTREDLLAALRGIRRNLAPTGVAVWDLNTLEMYATAFAEVRLNTADRKFVVWQGKAGPVAPAMRVRAVVHVFVEQSAGCWRRVASHHEQRHWPEREVRAAAAEAGLRIVEVLGQRTGVVLEPELDEAIHSKALYAATHAEREGGDRMDLGRP
jgi:ubiquinone/menaquinone biosynthesis C-methylase UbiE